MPTYSLRQHDNGTFYIHWTEGRRSKRESTSQTEEVAAQIYLGEWLKGEKEDRIGAASSYLVSDLWDLYYTRHLEKNAVDPDSADTCWSNLKVHFGALTLPEVTQKAADGTDKIEQYIALRKKGTIGACPGAPGTIRGELGRLKTCFNWHADPKRATISAADVPLFDLPADSPPRYRWLRAEEIKRLMTSVVEWRVDGRLSRVERFLWLALETAARLTAILELTWGRVDFELNTITYNVPGRRITKKRRATVPISAALRPVLLQAYEERDGDLVCGYTSPSVVWHAVQAVAKHAKVDDVSPHVMRHTAATHMLRNGVPIWYVAKILGDTVASVEKVYGHHVPDGMAVAAVDAIYGRIAPTPVLETTE
jgi:integrase